MSRRIAESDPRLSMEFTKPKTRYNPVDRPPSKERKPRPVFTQYDKDLTLMVKLAYQNGREHRCSILPRVQLNTQPHELVEFDLTQYLSQKSQIFSCQQVTEGHKYTIRIPLDAKAQSLTLEAPAQGRRSFIFLIDEMGEIAPEKSAVLTVELTTPNTQAVAA